jgi:RNA polymerase sigma-70 factor (ECF subfamily)
VKVSDPEGDQRGLALLREGRMQGLEPIYRRHSAAVYRYLVVLGASREAADDAMQEAFLSLAQQPQAFDPGRGQLGAYLAGIARHALLAQWRRQGREMDTRDEELEQWHDECNQAPSAEEQHFARHANHALWNAIGQLPFVFREALLLVDIQERSYLEAAQIAGIELNTLRTRVHRARNRLREVLNQGTFRNSARATPGASSAPKA